MDVFKTGITPILGSPESTREVSKDDLYRLLDLLPANDLKDELRLKIEKSSNKLNRMLLEQRITKELNDHRRKIETDTKKMTKELEKKRLRVLEKMREKLKTKKIAYVEKDTGFVFGFDKTVFAKLDGGMLKLLTMDDLDKCNSKGYRYDQKYVLLHVDFNPLAQKDDSKIL